MIVKYSGTFGLPSFEARLQTLVSCAVTEARSKMFAVAALHHSLTGPTQELHQIFNSVKAAPAARGQPGAKLLK